MAGILIQRARTPRALCRLSSVSALLASRSHQHQAITQFVPKQVDGQRLQAFGKCLIGRLRASGGMRASTFSAAKEIRMPNNAYVAASLHGHTVLKVSRRVLRRRSPFDRRCRPERHNGRATNRSSNVRRGGIDTNVRSRLSKECTSLPKGKLAREVHKVVLSPILRHFGNLPSLESGAAPRERNTISRFNNTGAERSPARIGEILVFVLRAEMKDDEGALLHF